ncbi:MAG: YifB family Mg chelatase-like AAA ATPase [Christensenellales bacterium]
MLSKILSYALYGLNGYKIDIEVDINAGIPSCDIVGLPDAGVKESRERVRSAIKNSGFEYPLKKIVVNLAPADRKKEGPLFDLAIAIGILAASGQLKSYEYKKFAILGELSLDGSIRHISGLLPILIAGLQDNVTKFIVPEENAAEASYIEGIEVYTANNLKQAVRIILGDGEFKPLAHRKYECINYEKALADFDFSEVKGQQVAKRALEIAVSGGHNILMIGPPGAGKTMLARCLPSIMPRMTFEEAIEVTKIHSIAGALDKSEGILSVRPFRSPHHTATTPSLTGGGSNSRPGEISLAHNGVLFLDEMPEYSRKTLETLRQPLEDGKITVARAAQTVEYPARFILIASMNPCPCGNYGSKKQECKCTSSQIHNYISRLSGPLLDRIDLHIEADSVTFNELRAQSAEENSATVRKRVERAREIQYQRFNDTPIYCNAQMSPSMIKKYCQIDIESEKLLENAFHKLSLSARATTRILKVARTIADIEGEKYIGVNHIAEAVRYRTLDRKYWL